MKLLEDMIKKYGEVRPGNVLKVDGFLNHRIDVDLVKTVSSITVSTSISSRRWERNFIRNSATTR